MHITNSSIRNEYIPLTGHQSERNHGMAAQIQSVSNTIRSQVLSCMTSITCGALMAGTVYTTGMAITYAVFDINNSSPPAETGSHRHLGRIVKLGAGYGALGGLVSGLTTTVVLRQCINLSSRPEFYANHKNLLWVIGAAVGLVIGSITGALYSIALNHLINIRTSEMK